MESHICQNDWDLFDGPLRDQLDIFFGNLSSKLDNFTSILGFIICIFGAAANLVHLQVLGSRFIPFTSVNRILFWIAICDIATVLPRIFTYTVLFLDSGACAQKFGKTLGHVRWLQFDAFITLYMHSVGFWLVATIAFVRFMALRRVRLSSSWMTPKRAKHIIQTVFLFVLPFCAPTLLIYEPRASHIMTDADMFETECIPQNGTRYWLQIRSFEQLTKKQACLVFKSHLWVSGIGCKVLPCIFLAALSMMLWRRLQRQATSRRHTFSRMLSRSQLSLRQRSQREKCTNIAIASITIIFLITELPHGVLSLLGGLFTNDVYFHVYGWVGPYLDLLVLINCMVNFVVMLVTSCDYRRAFRRVLFRESNPTTDTHSPRSRTTRRPLLEITDRGSKLSLSVTADFGSRLPELFERETNVEIATTENEVWL